MCLIVARFQDKWLFLLLFKPEKRQLFTPGSSLQLILWMKKKYETVKGDKLIFYR